jgi:GMP synthase-like glutamine amidotransferase
MTARIAMSASVSSPRIRVLVVQHHPAEGPGAIADWANARDHRSRTHQLEVVLSTDIDTLPNARDFDAVVVLGGPWCAFDADAPAWLAREKTWLAATLRDDVPIFAICLGAQLTAQALGASIARMPSPEAGWCEVELLDTGESLHVLQWHEDRFELPPDAIRIAANGHCRDQGFVARGGRIVGLQFHAEWTADIVSALRIAFGEDCPLQDAEPHPGRMMSMHAWLHRRLDDWSNTWTTSTVDLK